MAVFIPIPSSMMLQRSNNFDLVRMLAALSVLFSHQHALTGLGEPMILNVHTLGRLGVLVFFSVSGFLVTQSWLADPNAWRFFARRLLRIWPGFAVVITLSALVLGPLVSTLGTSAYFTHPFFSDYFLNLRFELRDELPMQFTGNHLPSAINGSLWTIPLELKCYIALAILGVASALRVRWLVPVLTAALAAAFFLVILPDLQQLPALSPQQVQIRYLLEFGLHFFAGASIALLKIHEDPRISNRAFIACWLLAALAVYAGQPYLAFWLTVPITTILAGQASTPYLRRAGRFGDISYGLYIYAFPTQQTLIWLIKDQLSWTALLALTVTTTAILAFASWHLVEKHALRLKPRDRSSAKHLERSAPPGAGDVKAANNL